MIVDDDPPILTLLEYNLKKYRHEVRTAKSGKEALEVLSDFKPDVIISDIMMPVMNGYEFCRFIRKNMGEYYRNIPFVFLTAKSDTNSVVKGFRHGADDYVTKPFDVTELISRIGSLIDKINLANTIETDKAFSGRLAVIPLPDILQVLEVGRKTGTLTVEGESDISGEIDFQDGFIVGAKADTYKGQDAVYHLLTSNNGMFKFCTLQHITPEMEPVATTHILMEGMRIIDELSVLNKIIPEKSDFLSVNGKTFENLKNRVDDPEILDILTFMGDKKWKFSDIVDTSTMGQLQTEVAVGKMITQGILLREKIPKVKTVEPPHQKAALLFKYRSILIAGLGNSAEWFLGIIMKGMNLHGVTKTKGFKFANLHILPRPYGNNIRFITVRGERRFYPVWRKLIKNTDAAIYVSKKNDIDFTEDMESFLQLAAHKERAIFIPKGGAGLKFSIAAEIYNCIDYIFENDTNMVGMFKSFLLTDHDV